MNLYVYQNFNNYFNKEIKRFKTLAEYGSPYFTQANVNFKPNDGVNTTFPIGGNTEYDGSGDYLIVSEDGVNIKSRWFIIDQKRNRLGQFEVTLRRDLISDFYDPIVNDSIIYLEKGWINNVSNPLIYNDEGYKPNQIKKSETPLMDKSKCKWLIGYVDKVKNSVTDDGKENDDGHLSSTFWNGAEMTTDVAVNIKYDETVDSWGSWDLWQYVNPANTKKGWSYPANIQTALTRKGTIGSTYYHNIYIANKNGYVAHSNEANAGTYDSSGTIEGNAKSWAQKYVAGYNNLDKALYSHLGANMSTSQYERLLALNGKIVYSIREQEFIQITTEASLTYNRSETVSITDSQPTALSILDGFTTSVFGNTRLASYTAWTHYGHINASGSKINTNNIKNYKWQTSDKGHAHLINEAYDAFAIPIATSGAGSVRIWDGSTDDKGNPNYGWIVADEGAGYTVAQTLIQKAGSGGYDLQLVPYSPLEDSIITEDSTGIIFRTDNLQDTFDYSIVRYTDNTARNVIFWLRRNSFSHTINHKIEYPSDEKKIKEANQLDVYRLSSGDYSSQYDFSPVRNRGVKRFEVDCTYKPYAPYIKVSPLFNENGLYGIDFDDMRGLVCSNTNYSISRAGDAWATYERNNLNYQNAWKRELDYADEMHKYDMIGNGINSLLGASGAGIGVGIATSSLGAGLASGIGSAVAGTVDLVNAENKYQLSRDNMIASHHEQMANIKAQPNTLVTAGANTINNKVFPLLVYYTCTDEEREMFNFNLEIYGMTINCLTDNIKSYLRIAKTSEDPNEPTEPVKPTYIRGQLIRLNNTNEDNHLVYEIAQELMRGIYLKGDTE